MIFTVTSKSVHLGMDVTHVSFTSLLRMSQIGVIYIFFMPIKNRKFIDLINMLVCFAIGALMIYL